MADSFLERKDQQGALAELGFRDSVWCGWEHAESAVWRGSFAGEQAFAKVFRTARKWRQERHAYQHWLAAVPAVPRLLFAEQHPVMVLVFTAVPGELVLNQHLQQNERTKVANLAGQWLQAFHGQPWQDDDALPLGAALAQRFNHGMRLLRERFPVVQQDLEPLRQAVTQVEAQRVLCHRDYSPRNWLWQHETGTFSVIDFEHSRADWWLLDIERLSRAWQSDAASMQAFWQGYGRQPSPEELYVFQVMQGPIAVSTIEWSRAHGDAAFAVEGQRTWQKWSQKFLGRVFDIG